MFKNIINFTRPRNEFLKNFILKNFCFLYGKMLYILFIITDITSISLEIKFKQIYAGLIVYSKNS